MKNQLFNVLNEYLKSLDIYINNSELELQLLSHPSYPSLHSLTGVLDHFSIENLALEVAPDLETLKQLPKFFIALVDNENGKELSVIAQQKDSVEVISGNKKKLTFSIDEFLNSWSGVIVVVEKDDTTANYEVKQTDNKTFLSSIYVISGLLLLAAFFVLKPSLFQSLHFTLSIIGVVVSAFIVKHELGFHSRAVEKFCTANKSTSCDSVLNSKGAIIFGHYKLSDICLIYFIGLTLAWIILLNTNTSFISISAVTLLTIPAIVYSIYYQYRVVKKWCPLCLAIVAVLCLQFSSLLILTNTIKSIKFDITSNFILFFSFIISASLWFFIKPLLKKQQDLEKLQIKHYKFIRNFDLFNAVYSKGKTLNTSLIDEPEIVLGNKNAPLEILLVTHPQCFYCKAAHTDLERLLKKHPNDIKATIRFNINITDRNAIGYKVTSRLIELYNTEPEDVYLNALHDAYKQDANLDRWLKHWKEASNSFDSVLENQRTWCHDNAINFTPALYVNGKEFPKEYERSDIRYFIEDLIEYNLETNTPLESNSVVI